MNKKFQSMAMVVMVLAICLVFSSCVTNKATTKFPYFDNKHMGLNGYPKYSILGAVTLEKDWYGIVGFSTPSVGRFVPSSDYYVYQAGGVTYVDLLEEAKKQYKDVDAVIDINIDFSQTKYMIFYAKRKNIVSGIAIKYSREEVGYSSYREEKNITE